MNDINFLTINQRVNHFVNLFTHPTRSTFDPLVHSNLEDSFVQIGDLEYYPTKINWYEIEILNYMDAEIIKQDQNEELASRSEHYGIHLYEQIIEFL